MTIKNGDLPAMPVEHMDYMHVKDKPYCNGLTKRERFAAMAMQGLLAKHGDDDYKCEQIACYAVAHADALLAELEKSK